jgi:hypothetical protein
MAVRDNLIKGWIRQTGGPRAGQLYRVKTGKSGQNIRVYGSGETAQAGPAPTTIRPARHGGVLVPFGTGTGAAGGPRAGQSYRSYYARGKGTQGTEYHDYGGGKVFGFSRAGKTPAQQQALINRFKTAARR